MPSRPTGPDDAELDDAELDDAELDDAELDDAVTILIDEARWHHRGRRWCHLVSDVSYDELHAFAAANGIPRRGFQGDHYDIPEEFRPQLIAAGAVVVESRVLLRRLKGAGLRLTPTQRRRVAESVTNAAARPGVPVDD